MLADRDLWIIKIVEVESHPSVGRTTTRTSDVKWIPVQSPVSSLQQGGEFITTTLE